MVIGPSISIRILSILTLITALVTATGGCSMDMLQNLNSPCDWTPESAMHTSLDDTAQPESGWYLSWVL